MSSNSDSAPKQKLRDFLAREVPSLSNNDLNDLMAQISRARDKYSKYEKGRKAAIGGYTYISKKRSCESIQQRTEELIHSLRRADLMVSDELNDFLGDQEFNAKMIGRLLELHKASINILEKLPSYVSQGRQLKRILYEWVIEMADIYEGVFKPRRADFHVKDKFLHFLKCWKPNEIPIYGESLSSRTIERVLSHREKLKRPDEPIKISV
jgi:hypothetical protein